MSPMLTRPVVAMSTVWRQLKPRPDATEASRALVRSLQKGASLQEALSSTSAHLARVAVSEASRRFDRAPLALFIVDVRDSLRRQLLLAGVSSADLSMRVALEQAARRVNQDTFVQHLINTSLEATGLYTESQVLEVVDEGRIARAVEGLFQRALCSLLTPNDKVRRLGQRSAAMEFSVAPSAPR